MIVIFFLLLQWSHGGEVGGYSVCDLSETVNNHTNSWLVSEYIDLQGANEVHIKLLFTIRQCPSGFVYCKQAFTVFKLQRNGPEIGGITKNDVLTGKFSLVQTVNATHVWTPGVVPRMNQANINVAVNGRGIYLAFQDTGACLSLASVVVSYTYCPNVIKHGVLFNKTSAPQFSLHNVTVKGTCSSGASPYPSNSLLAATCLSTGQWVKDDKITCLCTAGYELAGDTCAGKMIMVIFIQVNVNQTGDSSFNQVIYSFPSIVIAVTTHASSKGFFFGSNLRFGERQ